MKGLKENLDFENFPKFGKNFQPQRKMTKYGGVASWHSAEPARSSSAGAKGTVKTSQNKRLDA